MAAKSVKYKFWYLPEKNPKKNSLNVLMEESTAGNIIECTSSREIEGELKEQLKHGWALKVRTEVNGWGFFLYMEKIK